MKNRIFITSDHHFFHKNIIKYQNRPYRDVREMTESMIKIWNDVVGVNDVVLHLGDFFFNSWGTQEQRKEIVERLHGQISLIRGNHDRGSNKKYKYLGFKFVGDYLIKGKILFHHYYNIQDPQYPHKGVDSSKRISKENGIELVFHGHRHNQNPHHWIGHYNVCVDQHDFKPLDLMLILEQNNWKHLLPNGKLSLERE